MKCLSTSQESGPTEAPIDFIHQDVMDRIQSHLPKVDQKAIAAQARIVWSVLECMSNNPGRWIVLMGRKGSGKSLIAKSIFNSMVDRTHYPDCLMWPWHRLQAQVMQKGVDPVFRAAKQPVLVIDDLGLEDAFVSYMGTRVDWMRMLISERYDTNNNPMLGFGVMGSIPKVTIFTTHMSRDQLRQKYGQHIWERVEELSEPFYFPFLKSLRENVKSPKWEK